MTARYPWVQFSGPLNLSISEVRAGGLPKTVAFGAVRRVHLDEIEEDWNDVELDLELSTDELMPAELEGLELEAYVVLSSSTTNARIPVLLGPDGDDRWKGTLELRRAEVGGVMELDAYITAPDRAGRPLLRGASTPWSVVVDPGTPPAAPTQVPVVTKWVDFSSTGAPELCRRYPSAPYAVLLEDSKPVLYLNETKEGFRKLLLNEHAQTERRRLRDTVSTLIAASVTRALLQGAFDAVITGSDGADTPQPPDEPMFRQVCEGLASEMASVSDADQLYERMLQAATTSSAEVQTLWSELDLAISSLVSLGDTVIKVSEEVR